MNYKNFSIGIVVLTGVFLFGYYSPICFGSECGVTSNIEQTANLSSPEIIQRQLGAGEVILIDVREDEEWNSGHIAGAEHIPLGNLNLETTKDLPKDRPIYIYCRSGKRAGNAEIIMNELGFPNAKNIGGVIDWQNNGGLLVQ